MRWIGGGTNCGDRAKIVETRPHHVRRKAAMICGKLWRWWLAVGFCMGGMLASGFAAAETPATTRDTLVYKDGDRLHGSLVKKDANEIVFRSDRFGEVRVKAADAVVIPGVKAPPVATAAKTPAPSATAVPPAESKARAAAAKEEAEEERVTIWD